MSTDDLQIGVLDIAMALSDAVDMMSPAMANHHRRVAYLTYAIGLEFGLSSEEVLEATLAAAIHDIGAFSLSERMDILAFEDHKPGLHARAGYVLLKEFAPLSAAAGIIRFHHKPWANGQGTKQNEIDVPIASHLVHLADRIAVLFPSTASPLHYARDIEARIQVHQGGMFAPELVQAFHRLAGHDYLWLELETGTTNAVLQKALTRYDRQLDLANLQSFSRVMCRLIDFKSPFTATHTSGLAAVAVAMAEFAGFSQEDCELMGIAARLHDVGKLAIPLEILEKPGRLDADEWAVMRSHAFYTHKILRPFEVCKNLVPWSAWHQERMDGSGYPFGYQNGQISRGTRLMSVADVFVGITEDRPYRVGMTKAQATEVLRAMVDGNELDGEMVTLLIDHFDHLNALREQTQQDATHDYETFQAALTPCA